MTRFSKIGWWVNLTKNYLKAVLWSKIKRLLFSYTRTFCSVGLRHLTTSVSVSTGTRKNPSSNSGSSSLSWVDRGLLTMSPTKRWSRVSAIFDVSLPRISWSLFVYSRSISLSTALSISPKSSSESDEVSSSLTSLSLTSLSDSFFLGDECILSDTPLSCGELFAPPLSSFCYQSEFGFVGFTSTLIGFRYVSTSSRFDSTSIFSLACFLGSSDNPKSNSVC